jgi:hypothetical protein
VFYLVLISTTPNVILLPLMAKFSEAAVKSRQIGNNQTKQTIFARFICLCVVIAYNSMAN